jgi:hypothetical protein
MTIGQRERRVRMDENVFFTQNNKIPIQMTDVIKNEAPRGPHSLLHNQRSNLKF